MRGPLAFLSPRNLRLGIVAVPWISAAIYLYAFAADRYATESVVIVRQEGSGMTLPSGIDALSAMFGTSTSSREDQYMLRAHILSIDMLRQLDAQLDLRGEFSRPTRDWIFRMSEDSSQEEFIDFYRDHIDVQVDDGSGLVTIQTQAFTPETAQAINQEVVAISERFINESSHRLAREQMSFAENELNNARHKLDDTRDRLLRFQAKHGVLDPSAQVAANSGLTAELQAMLARQEAELKGLQGYLNNDAPQVRALQSQIDGLRAQLATEAQRGVINDDGASLNELAGQYQQLIAELEFASDAYRGALTGLETARIESTRKLKSLVLVESPALPESAEFPKRAYNLFALFLGLTLLYGVGRLIVATIEDHQE